MAYRLFKQLNYPGLILVFIFYLCSIIWLAHTLYYNQANSNTLAYPLQAEIGNTLVLTPQDSLEQSFKLVDNNLTSLTLLLDASQSAIIPETVLITLSTPTAKQVAELNSSQLRQSPLITIKFADFPTHRHQLAKLEIKTIGDPNSQLNLKSILNPTLDKQVFKSLLTFNQQPQTFQLMFRPEFSHLTNISSVNSFNWIDEISTLVKKIGNPKPRIIQLILFLSFILSLFLSGLFIYEVWSIFNQNQSLKNQYYQLSLLLLLALLSIIMV